MSFQEYFQSNKYVYVSNFLDKNNCQEYVSEFKELINQGLAMKDPQCPLSFSLGFHPLFDSLLEQLTPNIEAVTGKKLFPTYAYARWYTPGDELKIHLDRAACEISASITLGFEGEQWPIYVGHESDKQDAKQINMNVGDAIIYKGCELFHWREKYVEGQWQAQVFIHYVDQEGPNAEWKYDKRKELAHHSKTEHDDSYFLVKNNAFSIETCNKIINQFEKNTDMFQEAQLINNVVDKNIRDTKKIPVGVDSGIGATLVGIGLAANYHQWKFNITNSNQSEYLKYDVNGHFSEHIDTVLSEKNDQSRKLTVIAILNSDFEGGKLYLRYGSKKIYPSQKPGDVIIFPSFLNHGVEPITSGIRRSIVTWLVGPYLK
jgi:hypothetical protein